MKKNKRMICMILSTVILAVPSCAVKVSDTGMQTESPASESAHSDITISGAQAAGEAAKTQSPPQTETPVKEPDMTGHPVKNQALAYIRGFEDIQDGTLFAVKNYRYAPDKDEISNIMNLDLTALTAGGEYILLMPCYEGAQIRLETLVWDSNNFTVSADEIIRSIEITPDNYGYLVNANLSEGIPAIQAVITYNGRETSYQFNEANLADSYKSLILNHQDPHYVELSPTISIYVPDEMMMYFQVEQAELPAFTPGSLVAVLAEKGLLPGETQVLNFSTHERDGKKLIDLDLSAEYYEHLSSLGTSGEYAVAGSICNTFLEAYNADLIQITVNGSGFETGHATYDDYMGFFNPS